jgi:hypothetical protein
MAPKRNPQRDCPDQKPNPKGKQRAEPQSHDDAGDQAGLSSRPSGSSHNFPPPGHKNQKSKKWQEEESDGALSSDNSLVRDMGGPDPRKGLINHFINPARAANPHAATTNPSSPRRNPDPVDSSIPGVPCGFHAWMFVRLRGGNEHVARGRTLRQPWRPLHP